MQTFEAIDAETAKVLRKARNRLRSVGRRFQDIKAPDATAFVSFLSRPNGVACWFHSHREPQLYSLAEQFESTFEPGEERAAVIADALRVW